MANIPQLSFGGGEQTPKMWSRSDVEKHGTGCRQLQNAIPEIYGDAERRPGTIYIATSHNSTATIRIVPFIFSAEIAYEIELGNKYARFFYGGALLDDGGDVYISTPYLTAHLFELKLYQIGDVIWIVHPSYAQRKLSRTGVKTFELEEIDFRKGPFLTRNDLLTPENPSTVTLQASATQVGACGIINASADVFYPGHKGALFKIIHAREITVMEQDGIGTSGSIAVMGTFSFNTHGRWTGTIKLQRNENDAGWDDHRTYKSSNDRNIQLTMTEDGENVRYRINIAGSGNPTADIIIEEILKEGIVKIDAVVNANQAVGTVYSELESTSATKRWAEGAWSGARGYPSAITFLNNRCIYGGASLSLSDTEFGASQYPSLRI